MDNIYEFSTREYLFKSEPLKIGKNTWRFVVYKDKIPYKKFDIFADYEFVRNNCWEFSTEFSRYDSNDTYNGLPKTLIKLWNKHKEEYYNLIKDIKNYKITFKVENLQDYTISPMKGYNEENALENCLEWLKALNLLQRIENYYEVKIEEI